jgi:hypothetical protein
MRDVATVLQLRSLSSGALVRELPMPGYGSIKEFCGRSSLSQFYYSFQSMTDPGSTYWCSPLPGPCCCEPSPTSARPVVRGRCCMHAEAAMLA